MLQFKRELLRLWEQYYIYSGSRMKNVRLQMGTRSDTSLCQLLVKKKPPKYILIDLTLNDATTTITTMVTTNTTSNA